MMTYPGGMIHCSLGLMGEGSQPSVCSCVCVCVCVCVCPEYDSVFTPGRVP